MNVRPAALAARFFREESGQDLIEYGLLTGIITVSSILIFITIQGKIGPAYTYWQNEGQTNWEPPAPSAP